MRRLLDNLRPKAAEGWEAIIWAGVGYGAELPAVRRLPARRRVYLEPHPVLQARLQARCPDVSRESVLNLALWSCSGEHAFRLVSNPLKSSLLAPTPLLQRLPNLKLLGQVVVPTIGLDDLAGRCGLTPDAPSLLILDVAGAARDILAAASRATLGVFSHIVLRTGDEADYVGSSTLVDMDSLLSELGYLIEVDGHDEDAAGGAVLLVRDEAIWSRQARMTALAEQVQAEADEIQALKLHATQLGTARDEHAQLAVERQEQIDVLTVQVQAQVEQIEGLSRHASELGTARDQHAQLAQQLQAQIKESSREPLVQQLQQQVEQQAASIGQLRQQLVESSQASALSLKLQMLREADLRDLQERYQASLSVQERQHQMLVKLGERMSVASHYFHQLAESGKALPAEENDAVVPVGARADPTIEVATVPAAKRVKPTASTQGPRTGKRKRTGGTRNS